MIELPSLYPHQEELRDRLRASLAKNRRVILCANPGFGKTRTAKWIMGAAANKEPAEKASGMSLFCVHRRGLVDNASDSFNEAPELTHGVIMSGIKPSYGARVQVASIDTLLSWFLDDKKGYDTSITFDLIVFDETHSHLAKLAKFLKHHDVMRTQKGLHRAYVIGLSATPEAKGLADVYRDIVLGPPTEWLIQNGFLAPYRYVCGKKGDLGKLIRRGSEFTKDSESQAMEGMSGDLVRDWKRFAEGRPTVGFFPRRSHAKDARRELEAAGLRVGYVDGDTEDITRRRLFWSLDNGRLDYLCNVAVVERGTDIPNIGCVQLCVAIGSPVRFRQMLGRGSRFDRKKYPDKVDCLVLDHGGNVGGPPHGRHGFFEDDPQWSLDRSTSLIGDVAPKPTVECPNCNTLYRGGKCSNCGYEPTKRERKAQGLEWDGTELVEITATKEQRPKKQKTAEQLMISTLYSCGRSGRTWKQAVGMFFGMCRQQGTNYRIPKRVTVGGHTYRMLMHEDSRGGLRVQHLYPFTSREPKHGGELMEK